MTKPIWRILLIILLALLLLVTGKLTGIGEWFNLENISNALKDHGFLGILVFNALFIVGSLLHIPAMLFVLVAILVYGHLEGALLGYFGIIIAMSVNYYVVRLMGHKALNKIDNHRLQRMLSRLDNRPLLTVILIRLVFWAAPVVNYTLAMTSVRPKHYILGSSIGIILPVAVFTAAVYMFREMVMPVLM